MISKQDIIEQAKQHGFQDLGFTSADPFDSQKEILCARAEAYGKPISLMDLEAGTDFKNPEYISHLERAFHENEDERIAGMVVWAPGDVSVALKLSRSSKTCCLVPTDSSETKSNMQYR